jgi:hypothetical protein
MCKREGGRTEIGDERRGMQNADWRKKEKGQRTGETGDVSRKTGDGKLKVADGR